MFNVTLLTFVLWVIFLLKSIISIRKTLINKRRKLATKNFVHIKLFPNYSSKRKSMRSTTRTYASPDMNFVGCLTCGLCLGSFPVGRKQILACVFIQTEHLSANMTSEFAFGSTCSGQNLSRAIRSYPSTVDNISAIFNLA